MPTYVDDYLDSIAPSRPRRRRSAGTAEPFDLTPEQTTSLLGRVGGSALSGLSATANVLDLPGSSARDVIGLLGGGSWEKYNPFDQWLDPTGREADTNRVTGRDLLRGGGFVGKKDTWGNFAAGLGVDILTDPLMYLPPFGLTKAGVLAKQSGQLGKASGVATAKAGARVGPLKAGLKTTLGELPEFSMASRPFTAATDEALTKTAQKAGVGVEELLQQPLRKGVGVHIPFVGNVGGFNPPGAERVAGTLDWLGNALATSAPGKVIKGLFHAPAGNQFTTEGQQLAENIFDAKREVTPQIAAANRATHEMLSPALDEIQSQLGPDIIGAARKRIVDPAESRLFEATDILSRRKQRANDLADQLLDDASRKGVAAAERVDTLTRQGEELTRMGQDASYLESPLRHAEKLARSAETQFQKAEARAAKLRSLPFKAQQNAIAKAQEAVQKANDEFATLDHAVEISRVSDKLLRGAGEKSAKEALNVLGIEHTGDLSKVDDAIGRVIKSNKDEMAGLEGMGFDLKYLDEDRLNHLHRSVSHTSDSYLEGVAITNALRSEAKMLNKPIDAALQAEALRRKVPVEKLPANVVRKIAEKQLPPAVVRRVTEEVSPKSARKLLNTKTVVDTSRDTATRHLPTELINKLLVDPQLRAAANTTAGQTQAAQHILDTIPEFLDPSYVSQSKPQVAWDVARWAEKNRGVPGFTDKFDQQITRLNTPQAEHAIAQHADDLAAYIRRHPRREMYTNTTMADQTRYRAGLELKKATGNAVHNFLRESASKEGDVALAEAFQAAGMNPEKSLEYFAKQSGIDIGEASQLRVSQQTANAVSSVLSVAKAPAEWAQKIGNVFDSVNNALRAPLTVIWPAFHTRNSASGQFINMTTGLMQTPADFKLYADSLLESAKLAKLAKRGGDSPLLRELVDYEEIIFGKGGRGVAGEHLVHGKTFQDISLDAAELPDVLNRIPGVKQVSKGYSKLLKAGGKAMEKVEFSNRAPLYVYLRKKGWNPLQAAIEVEKRHFDYSQLTSFERNVMKRAGLFYSFSRRMAPLVMDTLVTKPGGAMAQTIKAFGKAGSGQDERPVPKYIRDQSSSFLGELPGGSLRYLTGLGLPHEDTFSLAGEPIKELLSRATPLIKAPAELAFGESLFQKGRALEDLDPGVGRVLSNIGQLRDDPSRILHGGEPANVDPVTLSPSLEYLISNSPLSRGVSSARTLTDPRKGLAAKAVNLLTGVKLSDVSPASQDTVLREAAAAAMKRLGGKTFTRTFVPKDRVEKMSAQEQTDVLLLNSLMSELARRTKERKNADGKK